MRKRGREGTGEIIQSLSCPFFSLMVSITFKINTTNKNVFLFFCECYGLMLKLHAPGKKSIDKEDSKLF